MKLELTIAAALSLALAAPACVSQDTGEAVGNTHESGFHFIPHDAEADLTNNPDDGPSKLTIVDHMGTPLTSTSQVNRDDDYQLTAPNSATSLGKFLINLRKMHVKYGQQLQDLGFESCSDGLLLDTVVTYCTQQRLWPGGPQVQDVVVPDSIEIELDEPAKWPNSRPLKVCSADDAWHTVEDCAALGGEMEYLQINDLVLAMGFLDLGRWPGDCPVAGCIGTDCEMTECTINTFRDMELNIAHNDKPLPDAFPWMAAPW